MLSCVGEVGNEIGGPGEAAGAQPGRERSRRGHARRARASISAWSVFDGGRGEGERDLAEAELEQAVAAARLAVIVALGRGAGEDLDLAVVEAEAPIDRRDLRLDRALVRQQDAGSGQLSMIAGAIARAVDVGERLGGEDDGGVLLAQRLQPFAELAGKALRRRAPASPRR